MALSTFPRAVDDAIAQLVLVANVARGLRDGTGPVRWSEIERLMHHAGGMLAAYDAAKAEAQKQLSAAQAYIADMGGPATLAEFNTAMVEVETRVDAFASAVETFIGTKTSDEFAQVVNLNVGGRNARILQRRDIMPDATATQLRGTAVLANLITALEAVGA